MDEYCQPSVLIDISSYLMAAITPIAATFIALFVASVHGDSSCKITPCNCSFTNIEILRNYIDETVNAAVAAVKKEVNNTISALNATADERTTTVSALSATVGAHDVSIAKLLSQPGKMLAKCAFCIMEFY
jgi:hypothetical protein